MHDDVAASLWALAMAPGVEAPRRAHLLTALINRTPRLPALDECRARVVLASLLLRHGRSDAVTVAAALRHAEGASVAASLRECRLRMLLLSLLTRRKMGENQNVFSPLRFESQCRPRRSARSAHTAVPCWRRLGRRQATHRERQRRPPMCLPRSRPPHQWDGKAWSTSYARWWHGRLWTQHGSPCPSMAHACAVAHTIMTFRSLYAFISARLSPIPLSHTYMSFPHAPAFSCHSLSIPMVISVSLCIYSLYLSLSLG